MYIYRHGVCIFINLLTHRYRKRRSQVTSKNRLRGWKWKHIVELSLQKIISSICFDKYTLLPLLSLTGVTLWDHHHHHQHVIGSVTCNDACDRYGHRWQCLHVRTSFARRLSAGREWSRTLVLAAFVLQSSVIISLRTPSQTSCNCYTVMQVHHFFFALKTATSELKVSVWFPPV